MMATTAISTTSATQDLPTLPEAAVIGSMVDEALTLALASGSSHLPLRLDTASSNSLQQPRLQSEANHTTTDEADSQTPANNSSIAPRLASSAADAETICTLRAAVLSPTLHHAGALHAASSLPTLNPSGVSGDEIEHAPRRAAPHAASPSLRLGLSYVSGELIEHTSHKVLSPTLHHAGALHAASSLPTLNPSGVSGDEIEHAPRRAAPHAASPSLRLGLSYVSGELIEHTSHNTTLHAASSLPALNLSNDSGEFHAASPLPPLNPSGLSGEEIEHTPRRAALHAASPSFRFGFSEMSAPKMPSSSNKKPHRRKTLAASTRVAFACAQPLRRIDRSRATVQRASHTYILKRKTRNRLDRPP